MHQNVDNVVDAVVEWARYGSDFRDTCMLFEENASRREQVLRSVQRTLVTRRWGDLRYPIPCYIDLTDTDRLNAIYAEPTMRTIVESYLSIEPKEQCPDSIEYEINWAMEEMQRMLATGATIIVHGLEDVINVCNLQIAQALIGDMMRFVRRSNYAHFPIPGVVFSCNPCSFSSLSEQVTFCHGEGLRDREELTLVGFYLNSSDTHYDIEKGDKLDLFAERLREARVAAGLNQRALGLQASIPSTILSMYELGKCKPTFDELRRLCVTLGVGADYLMGLASPRAGVVEKVDPRDLLRRIERIEASICDLTSICRRSTGRNPTPPREH